jgi:hypothetical protein
VELNGTSNEKVSGCGSIYDANRRDMDLRSGGRPISPGQLQKILKFVDTVRPRIEFLPPTAQYLGISSDPTQKLPVVAVVTDDHKVYFCRSEQSGRRWIFGENPHREIPDSIFAAFAYNPYWWCTISALGDTA